MIVRSENFVIKSEEITKEKVISLPKNTAERKALQLILDWRRELPNFIFHTSGSTGKAKKITISRKKIRYSTEATFGYIDPDRSIKSTLLCTNPEFIGGAMVVFRAIIKGLDLFIAEPCLDPIASIPSDEDFDLVSMVPLQFEKLIKKDLARFSVILVGGASLNKELLDLPSNTQVFLAYGMTETASHIALRRPGNPIFQTTGDAAVENDPDGCLKIKGSITESNWINTNDLARMISPNKFEWLGRRDFIINSGGVKINPVEVEKKLSDRIRYPFVISSKPDKQFGEKLVLIVEAQNKKTDIDFSFLHKYEKPKEILYWDELIRTTSGKIDRRLIKKILHTLAS